MAASPDVGVEVHFSPNGGCTAALVQELNAASESILIQAYIFTSRAIVSAVIAAKRRGLDVEIILDQSQKGSAASQQVMTAGIPLWYDCVHNIAHNKVMIIDGQIVVGGSFNYTSTAERDNAENMPIMRSASLAAAYRLNWLAHQKHSVAAGTVPVPAS